jgi:pullulanase/glycogen debranching enzyme
MILMGDEVAKTQYGNNNTYCQDNELNWLNWQLTEENASLLRFVKLLIAFRHAHPVLRSTHHLTHRDYVGSGYPDLSWHGEHAWNPDWSPESRTLAFLLDGKVRAPRPARRQAVARLREHRHERAGGRVGAGHGTGAGRPERALAECTLGRHPCWKIALTIDLEPKSPDQS